METSPQLLITEVTVIDNHSNVVSTPKRVDITLNINVVGTGDFTPFVKDGKIDEYLISWAVLTGRIKIEPMEQPTSKPLNPTSAW